MDIDDAGERPAGAEPLRTNRQEVIVVRESDLPQPRRPHEQRLIILTAQFVVLHAKDIDPRTAHAVGHGPRHMLVQIV